MPSTASLIQQLVKEHPALTFTASDEFRWSPTEHTVFYDPSDGQASALVLHELSHALLKHLDYSSDVALLAMEAAAWDESLKLAPKYKVVIDQSIIDENLDTYRDWLHARSTCPACTATGYQIRSDAYSCPASFHDWRVNEARSCQLRRYSK